MSPGEKLQDIKLSLYQNHCRKQHVQNTDLVFHVVLHELRQGRKLLPSIEIVEVSSVLDLDVGDIAIATPRIISRDISIMNDDNYSHA